MEGEGTESVVSAAARAAGTGGGGGTGGLDTCVPLFCSCALSGAGMPRSCGVSAVGVSSCGVAGAGSAEYKRAFMILASAPSALVAFSVAFSVAFT